MWDQEVQSKARAERVRLRPLVPLLEALAKEAGMCKARGRVYATQRGAIVPLWKRLDALGEEVLRIRGRLP